MGAGSSAAEAVRVDSEGSADVIVAKRGPGTFRGIEAAYRAALAAGAKRIKMTVREGIYTASHWIDLEIGGREVCIRGEGCAVLRSPRPLSLEVMVINGDHGKASLRDLTIEGNVSFHGKHCHWSIRDCKIDGKGHWGVLGFSNCDASRLSLARCHLLGSGRRDAVIFKGQSSSLKVVGCEISTCRSGIRCGDSVDCHIDIRDNRVHDCERAILVFKPAHGHVERNEMWKARFNLLLCSRSGKEMDELPGLRCDSNRSHFGEPEGLAPRPVGPRYSGATREAEEADFSDVEDDGWHIMAHEEFQEEAALAKAPRPGPGPGPGPLQPHPHPQPQPAAAAPDRDSPV
eukprot:tig00000802_g4292.t1